MASEATPCLDKLCASRVKPTNLDVLRAFRVELLPQFRLASGCRCCDGAVRGVIRLVGCLTTMAMRFWTRPRVAIANTGARLFARHLSHVWRALLRSKPGVSSALAQSSLLAALRHPTIQCIWLCVQERHSGSCTAPRVAKPGLAKLSSKHSRARHHQSEFCKSAKKTFVSGPGELAVVYDSLGSPCAHWPLRWAQNSTWQDQAPQPPNLVATRPSRAVPTTQTSGCFGDGTKSCDPPKKCGN